MYILFLLSLIGIFTMLPIHFLSVEHSKFQKRYGKEIGNKITNFLGIISGWGFFIFLFGIWISPQPKFIIPFFKDYTITFLSFIIFISFFRLIISLPFLFSGIYFGIKGVKATTLKVSETHRTEKVITSGIYSKVRHPQYLGANLAHIGLSILLSSLFSFLITPLIILYNYIVS